MVAIKIVRSMFGDGKRETSSQCDLNHPNICQFIAFLTGHRVAEANEQFDYIVSENIRVQLHDLLNDLSNLINARCAKTILSRFYCAISI